MRVLGSAILASASVGLLASCQNSSSSAQGIAFSVLTGESGFGADLYVDNRTASSICIPPGSLTADSGSVRAYRSGHEFFSDHYAEYSDKFSGSGPFYIVSSRSDAKIPLDDDHLDLKDGRYIFRIRVEWIDCNALSSGRKYPGTMFKSRIVNSAIDYKAFR